MKWSARQLRIARKLQAIERSRRSAAEVRLLNARQDQDRASEQTARARQERVAAEERWLDHLAEKRFDPLRRQSLSRILLARDADEGVATARENEAKSTTDRRRSEWCALEASVRAGEEVIMRARRQIERRTAETREREVGDQVTWKWFSQ